MSSLKLTVITVSFNARQTIQQAIESVLSQKYSNLEYIIIDGGSKDGTAEIIQKYDSKIAKFISEPDDGIYHAMNKGIKHATGEFIYFLGADDYLIDCDSISDIIAFLSLNSKCKLLYGNIELRSKNKVIGVHKPPLPEHILDELIVGCLPHQATFAHISLFTNPHIGLFNEQYKTGSDYEWFIKVATEFRNQPGKIAYLDRTVASYNVDGSSGNLKDMEKILTEVFAIQNKADIFQSEYWLKRRIEKYQAILAKPQGHWGLERLNIEHPSQPVQEMWIRKIFWRIGHEAGKIRSRVREKFSRICSKIVKNVWRLKNNA